MKKILALVLTAVMVLSMGAFYVAATDGYTTVKMEVDITADANGRVDEIPAVVYLGGNSIVREYKVASPVTATINGEVKTLFSDFEGPSAYETVTWGISYKSSTIGSGGGMPKGVNGEDLLNIRIGYDRSRKAYTITMTPVKNPTVEIYYNVSLTVKFAKRANNTEYSQEVTWGPFDLMNKRYYSKDAYKDANGYWRIDAGEGYPVIDESVFNKAYNGRLIVNYPKYTVTFPTVKNQDVALNLEATMTKPSTVALDDKTAIAIATFHDIYVKDACTIEFNVNADVQNYKGVTLYAYKMDANGNPIKDTQRTAYVTNSNTLVFEIPAGTRLSAYGEAGKTGTYGIYAVPQESTSSTTSSTSSTAASENPKTGASDIINVASVFAVVSLAAAGFVAVGKAGRK